MTFNDFLQALLTMAKLILSSLNSNINNNTNNNNNNNNIQNINNM